MPLSPSATRDLLAQLGHQPKRFLGQNFLVDGNIVRKSLELAAIQPGNVVVEVGPGLGTLTAALLEAGVELWAVEKDRTLHAHLTETLQPRFPQTFHLLEADAVDQPLAGLPAERAVAGFKVVANLPYAIATPWLDAVLAGPLPERMVLMLQLEAAQRYTAVPGTKSFGAISIFLQAAYDTAPGHKVGAGCFFPKPDVESHLLNLVRKPEPFVFRPEVKTLIRSCFQQRRKQLGALLRARLTGVDPQLWRELLAQAGLTEQTRPEAVPVSWWISLSRALPPLA
ncbi:16S rRNA (adenine(1518)-N(6)/adenine(1519)-N(6))-dimethyltransferase RsmA [Opitutus sp. ER46]|uniref:16S rRNA (adenine(1518)-N(6)/adenine(1519)-N(6))- dimethyltransferase RsmA n=1 Tax=Opitutus sp. ER46 TaxID=2161864 RepID=UPI000D302700|nr:16S rRNA (adenine(1518)-N(6)/adenine(1519)-N(6))-dimethyltransferase RsmA [Opitutus sp. ER46]PTX94439.1 ribosomal RNA small subunit methyltransferase A [Opitutus sp. ER46]